MEESRYRQIQTDGKKYELIMEILKQKAEDAPVCLRGTIGEVYLFKNGALAINKSGEISVRGFIPPALNEIFTA